MALGRKTGGRQKGSLNKSTIEIKELAQQYGPAAVERLAVLAGLTDKPGSESEATQVGAMKELLDRGYGKAVQAVTGPNGDALFPHMRIIFGADAEAANC